MKLLLITLAMLANSVNAWFGTGHLLVVRIAYEILEKQSPSTLQNVENILAVFKKSDPKLTSKETAEHGFVECATFADDIKYRGGGYQKGWHFIDSPLLTHGGKMSDFDFTPDSHNITEAISTITHWFNHVGDYKDSYDYQQIIQNKFMDDETLNDDASVAMRLLIHYVGDIHQPLHATAQVDSEYPKGDRGGNDVPIKSKDGIKELHALWDSFLYEFSGYAKLPFTASGWKTNGDDATRILNTYTISDDVATNLDPMVWAADSFKISKDFVYTIEENQLPSDDYVKTGKALAEKQIAIAGHRLANLLMSLKLENTLEKEQSRF